MPCCTTDIELLFGPRSVGATDVLEDTILNTIRNAGTAVYLAAQQLSSRRIVDGLIDASSRGVKVKVMLELDYLVDREASLDPWTPGGWFEENRTALTTLFRARIPVRLDRTSRLLHNNFVVADPDSSEKAVLLSTSANLTDHGLNTNLNHLLRLNSDLLAQSFRKEFDTLWNDKRKSPHNPTPDTTSIGDTSVKLVFSPEHAPEMEVMKQIAKAKKQIQFTMFSFSGSSGIDDAIIAARNSGISVQGVLDGNQSNQKWAATHDLAGAGVDLRVSREDFGGKLHHKLMVIDNALVIIGTFNFSASAVRFNEEALLILGDLDRTPTAEEKQLAEYAKNEIERIARKLSIKV